MGLNYKEKHKNTSVSKFRLLAPSNQGEKEIGSGEAHKNFKGSIKTLALKWRRGHTWPQCILILHTFVCF